MKSVVHYFTICCFFLNVITFSLPAHAGDEVITHIEEGAPAPFTGTLLNPEAAARILVDLENNESACQIIIDTELGRQIDFLETQLQKPKIFTKEVTFVLGVIAGVALTAAAGYTMGQVAGN